MSRVISDPNQAALLQTIADRVDAQGWSHIGDSELPIAQELANLELITLVMMANMVNGELRDVRYNAAPTRQGRQELTQWQ